MLGGVTRPVLPHLPGVPHLHANRPLISQSQISTCIFSPFDAFVIEHLEHLLRARVLRIFDTRKLMHEPIAHIRYIKILTWLRGFRAKIVNFSRSTLLSRNSQKRLEHKENQTKYRKMTRKPRSHVRILIYRTWAFVKYQHAYPSISCTVFFMYW